MVVAVATAAAAAAVVPCCLGDDRFILIYCHCFECLQQTPVVDRRSILVLVSPKSGVAVVVVVVVVCATKTLFCCLVSFAHQVVVLSKGNTGKSLCMCPASFAQILFFLSRPDQSVDNV